MSRTRAISGVHCTSTLARGVVVGRLWLLVEFGFKWIRREKITVAFAIKVKSLDVQRKDENGTFWLITKRISIKQFKFLNGGSSSPALFASVSGVVAGGAKVPGAGFDGALCRRRKRHPRLLSHSPSLFVSVCWNGPEVMCPPVPIRLRQRRRGAQHRKAKRRFHRWRIGESAPRLCPSPLTPFGTFAFALSLIRLFRLFRLFRLR